LHVELLRQVLASLFSPQLNFHASDFRFLPVALFAVMWLKTKIYFGTALRLVGKRFGALVRRFKRRVFRERPLHELDMQARESIGDNLAELRNFE
jgi:hypothetical protein